MRSKRVVVVQACVCMWSLPAIGHAQPAHADSLVLERSLCLGTCPAYRLRLGRDGTVDFASRNPGDSTRAQSATAPTTLPQLLARAVDDGFFRLPSVIAADRALCPDWATDHATVIVSFFDNTRVWRVEHYWGCFLAVDHSQSPVLRDLRAFESAIDSATQSARWVRPARFQRGAAQHGLQLTGGGWPPRAAALLYEAPWHRQRRRHAAARFDACS